MSVKEFLRSKEEEYKIKLTDELEILIRYLNDEMNRAKNIINNCKIISSMTITDCSYKQDKEKYGSFIASELAYCYKKTQNYNKVPQYALRRVNRFTKKLDDLYKLDFLVKSSIDIDDLYSRKPSNDELKIIEFALKQDTNYILKKLPNNCDTYLDNLSIWNNEDFIETNSQSCWNIQGGFASKSSCWFASLQKENKANIVLIMDYKRTVIGRLFVVFDQNDNPAVFNCYKRGSKFNRFYSVIASINSCDVEEEKIIGKPYINDGIMYYFDDFDPESLYGCNNIPFYNVKKNAYTMKSFNVKEAQTILKNYLRQELHYIRDNTDILYPSLNDYLLSDHISKIEKCFNDIVNQFALSYAKLDLSEIRERTINYIRLRDVINDKISSLTSLKLSV